MAGGGSEPKKVSTYLLKPSLLPNGSDSYRIQTCNLLIRSQMLYSVELRSRGKTIKTMVTPTGFKPVTF